MLSSPSGAGKTTLSRLLLEKDLNLKMSVSVTTRNKRPNEVEGRDYYFVDEASFRRRIDRNEFLEYAEVFGRLYGTPAEVVERQLDAGVDVLFDIDWQGTEQITTRCRGDVVSVFILPPSMAELEKRLRTRAQDDEETIRTRMSKASDEISHWHAYDYVMVNHDVEKSLQAIHAILQAERLRRVRQHGLEMFVDRLLSV